MIPTLIGVTLVLFLLVRSVPGDVVDLIGGDFGAADPSVKAALRKEYSLDQNIPVQYAIWARDIVRFDFGTSIISGRTVSTELKHRLPVTFELGILSLLISLTVALPVGIISAVRQDSPPDYIGRSFAILMLSTPGFWIAIILITLAGRYFTWGIPPKIYVNFQDDPISNLKMLAAPSMIIGGALSGVVMRFTRSSMLDTLRQDYIRTAWSKGLKERTIIVRHALRNALIPVVTVIGLQVPLIVGGAIIIEQIYNIPGVGRYYLFAINSHDYPVIQGINLIVAVVIVFMNLAVDLLYSVLDPRIRYT